ncbi:MAG TPA: cell division ATP-binding protein FtsE [Actinomycetota bacterium]|nr:cell division ATP-binding protein FtsE [Actinomycetota bacterium]
MIETVNLRKVYQGNVVALDGITLRIEKGEFVFLVGPSGSGKSTLTKIMMRDEDASEGEVRVCGFDLNKISRYKVPYLRRRMGVVFQDYKLLPNKTVFENVAFALEVTGRKRPLIEKLVPPALEVVGLANKLDRFPHQLSGGEQQRVSIARAFVNQPQLLLCDEPTGNLDPATSLEIVRLLDRINRTGGTTVVIATHDHAIVDTMRRRVIELEHGHLVRDQHRGVYGPVGG